ncbi:glycosyltransferase [Paractinoplanes toevensis]|uniref:Glycosyltransferase n=1 Tax=Paractinoplanes toevensis TaxID=571911 RepID=A0A919W4Q4_9ACTN|nr:glycosyltransferase [Actinoplanes toevensis]GIM94384.1 hypothetical protein Ato02nite_061770 [Actinoplanes toevensis]
MFVVDDIDAVGGVQTVTHTLAQHLARRGHPVHVVGLYTNPAPAPAPEQPLYRRTVLDAPAPGSPPDPARNAVAKRRMRRLLAATGAGVLVMASVHVSLWLDDLDTSRWGRVGHYHGSYEYARGHYHLGIICALWAGFDACVFLSPDDAAGFAAHTALPATWIPNPLPDHATAAATRPATPPRVLAVGRLTAIKRFDLAIDAFARAATADWQLHLIGHGDQDRALRRHADQHGLLAPRRGPEVVLRGGRPTAAMPAEYAAAHLLIVTSDHEGFGMVIAEAASAGIPTVAFDVSGGVRSLVRHDRTGLLVPPGDTTGLTRAIRALMLDGDRCRALGHAARAAVHVLNPHAVTDRWEQLLTHVAERVAHEVAS